VGLIGPDVFVDWTAHFRARRRDGNDALCGEGGALESRASEVGRDMLALGVIIAKFEERFLREGETIDSRFHQEWEAAIAAWWRQAEIFESLPAHEITDDARAAHAVTLARMFKFPG
jgi:hypothetical protein